MTERLSDSELDDCNFQDRDDEGLGRDIVGCSKLNTSHNEVCEKCCERLAELGRRQAWTVLMDVAEGIAFPFDPMDVYESYGEDR